MDNKDLIINFCKELGLDTIGFMNCRTFHELKDFFEERKIKGLENEFEEKDIEKRVNPFFYMEDGKTIISIAFPYHKGTTGNGEVNFSKYTLGADYHRVISLYLDKICSFIESLGGKAISFVDSNSLPERFIASQCGIGFIGKNNMLITNRYGSYVFLGEIITDLAAAEDIPMTEKCGECSLCMEECPTKAINKKMCNPNICLSYITQKKDIENLWFDKFEGRLFGCDSCQNVCPHNMNKKVSGIKEFEPLVFMEKVQLEDILYLDNKSFKESYKVTSCGWRGKNLLQRNALINYAKKKGIKNVDVNKIKSPYLMDYYNRLL